MPRWFIGLGILLGSLLGVLFTGYSVSAASQYDDVIRVVDELILNNGTESVNLSTSWLAATENALRERGKHTDADNMMATIGDPANSWAVIQNGENEIYVLWSAGKTTNFYFTDSPPLLRSDGQLCQTRGMSIDASGVLTHPSTSIQCYNLSNAVWFGNNAAAPGIFILNYPITYPAEYEGEIIPDSYSPEEVPKVDLQPDFNLKVDTKGNVNLKYADNLDWDFKKGASISVNKSDSGCSAGDLINLYTYDNYDEIDLSFELEEAGWYTINVVTTETGILPWKTCFNWQGQEINISAINCTTINDFYTCKEIDPEEIYNQCMNSDFPFIHIKDCMAAFGRITSILSFGTINPLDQFSYESSASCRQLNVLDDWISRPDQVICAQFPSSVRDTVTPFVTFGLSLTVLGYMINRTSKDVS